MTRTGVLLALLTGLALVALVAMRVWTIPAIRAAAGGIDMFDLWVEGYSVDHARAFLARLSPEGRALYLGPQRVLDTILPVALTGVLAATGYLVARRWFLPLAVVLVFVPLVYFGLDMLENAQVAEMLRRGGADASMAEAASRYTVWKMLALRNTISLVAFVAMMRALAVAIGRFGRKG